MFRSKSNTIVNILLVLCFFVLLYYVVITSSLASKVDHLKEVIKLDHLDPNNFNVWLIITNINERSLKYKFRHLLDNLLNVSSVPLKFNLIVDNKSLELTENELKNARRKVDYSFYSIEDCTKKIDDVVQVMTPHFSSRPGTYYSGALFYISLGLQRIAPQEQKRAILLDCDLFFKQDIALLFNEFHRFKATALYGLAPELSPVYLHALHQYKSKHNTTFGTYYNPSLTNSKPEVHPNGFQGYNSGVVLLNLDRIRKNQQLSQITSKENVTKITSKYKFRGSLGDQDFYTLMGYEYPDLIQTLHCGYNRQLCTWWKDKGYNNIFDKYFKCDHSIVVLHGNCKTKIPQ